jgi:hypothetical protein
MESALERNSDVRIRGTGGFDQMKRREVSARNSPTEEPMRRVATIAAALTTLTLIACDAPTAPDDTYTAALETVSVEGSDLTGLEEYAATIPGFGGLWFDRLCNLHVILTDAGDPAQAKEVLTPLLRRLLAAAPRCPEGAEIVVQRGQFTYTQLVRWLHELRPVAEMRGVKGVQLNIPANRIVIAVANRRVAGAVLEALTRLGIPHDAVHLRIG